MDSKDGLVARVWSDSGEVPVGEVTYTEYTADPAVAFYGFDPAKGDDMTAVAVFDPINTVTVNITNTKEWRPREEWESILRAWVRNEIVPQVRGMVAGPVGKVFAKPSDPNAKPALPALTRVGGNKRGPGWCDE